MLVNHKFINRHVDPKTEILIIGTFNPEGKDNKANFFYSRGKNYLWQILPSSYNEPDMRQSTREEKERFIKSKNIDFIDIISSVDIEEDHKTDYSDKYLSRRMNESGWRDIVPLIKSLPLKRACFTRKGFNDVPQIGKRVSTLKTFFESIGIPFTCLISPARFYSQKKQSEWNVFLLDSPIDTQRQTAAQGA